MEVSQLLELERQIVPDLLAKMMERHRILSKVKEKSPIGRRTLAKDLNLTERVLRKEVEQLTNYSLINTDRNGIRLSDNGYSVLNQLDEVLNHFNELTDLSVQLKSHYQIAEVIVIRGDADSELNVQKELSKRMAELLEAQLSDGSIVAVAGGSTMANIGDYLRPVDGKVLFVPARGGLGEEVRNQANYIASILADAAKGEHKVLHAPDHLSEGALYNLMSEPMVEEVLSLIKQSNVVIHGIGEAITMAKRRQASNQFIQKLKEKSAVGEAFGYYFNNHGEIVEHVKTIGLQLQDLKEKEMTFAVAGGESKKQAVHAYMQIAPKNTVLMIDEVVAKYLINNL